MNPFAGPPVMDGHTQLIAALEDPNTSERELKRLAHETDALANVDSAALTALDHLDPAPGTALCGGHALVPSIARQIETEWPQGGAAFYRDSFWVGTPRGIFVVYPDDASVYSWDWQNIEAILPMRARGPFGRVDLLVAARKIQICLHASQTRVFQTLGARYSGLEP